MPREIFHEIEISRGLLKDWITEPTTRSSILLDEHLDGSVLTQVLERGYGEDLRESEIAQAGKDPFLVSYCLVAQNRVVVTKEIGSIVVKCGIWHCLPIEDASY
jgi:hypothetical protein